MNSEFKEIQKKFNEVLIYSQEEDLRDINTDDIFEQWETNKKWFLDEVGSPIYQANELFFHLDENTKKQKREEFLSWVYDYCPYDIYNFLHNENIIDLYENKLLQDYMGYQKGTRVSKILMKEFKRFDSYPETVRQRLSMLIQEDEIKGTVCMSVHPLDYLSASENNYNWRSCHALDGEYRAGNVSYMVDDCTIMFYLKGEHDGILPHFPSTVPWNNKKWRCYVHLDRVNHIAYMGKQYPFTSNVAYGAIAEILRHFGYFFKPEEKKQLLEEYNRFRYNIPITWDEYICEGMPRGYFAPVGIRGEVTINGYSWTFDSETKVIVGNDETRRIVPMKRFITTDKDAYCYNDVILNHSYSPWAMVYGSWTHDMPLKVDQPLVVGRGITCPICHMNPLDDSDCFCCHNCKTSTETCTRCGCIDERDQMFLTDSGYICADCAADLGLD